GTLLKKIYSPYAQQDEHFGDALAVRDGQLIIGAFRHSVLDPPFHHEGAIYFYDLNRRQFTGFVDVSRDGLDGNLGFDVSLSARSFIAGAPAAFSGPYYGSVLTGDFSAKNTKLLFSPNPTSAGVFGQSVAANDQIMAISEPGGNGSTGVIY